MERWRERRFGAADRLAPVLPIVLYIGRARWTAAARVIDLVTPQAAGTGDGEATGTGHAEAGGTWRADPRFAGDGYVLLDSHRVGPDDLRHDNAAALLECNTSSDVFARVTEARRRTNGGVGAG